MPRLVNGAVERLAQVVFFDAGGDAHVAQGELGHKGVVGLVLAAAVEVIAQVLDDLQADGKLLGLGEVRAQAGIVGWRARGDLPNQGNVQLF